MQTHDAVHCFDTKVDYVHLHMFSCTHIARLFAYPYSYTYRFVHVLKAAVYCPELRKHRLHPFGSLIFPELIALAECLKIR